MRSPRLLALLLATPLALAQPTPPDAGPTPLEEGARALLFQVGPDLNLLGLDGGTISYKRHASEERAVRLGVTVSGTVDVDFDSDTDREQLSVQATALSLRYRRSRTPVYLYTGFGPTGGVQVFRADGVGNPSDAVLDLRAGLAGVVGVEWIVAEAIGITGEFGQELTLGGQIGGVDALRVRFVPRGARLGVAVYF